MATGNWTPYPGTGSSGGTGGPSPPSPTPFEISYQTWLASLPTKQDTVVRWWNNGGIPVKS